MEEWLSRTRKSGQRPLFIVMIERLGDLIACSPIARQLREHDPSLAIAWVCSKKYSAVFSGNPYIDAVFHEESLAGWLLSKRSLSTPFECYELFLDTQRCCWTGMRLPGRNSGINHQNYLVEGRNLLLSYAQAAGISEIQDIEPELYLQGSFPELPAALRGKPLMAIHFDSEDPDRQLSLETASRFVEVAHRKGWAVAELGLRPIASKVNRAVYFPGNSLPLHGQILLLKSALHFSGVDSAFLHCANALRIPSTLFLGKFRNFKSFQTFSGSFLLSGQCKLLRGDVPIKDLPPEFPASLVHDIRPRSPAGDSHA